MQRSVLGTVIESVFNPIVAAKHKDEIKPVPHADKVTFMIASSLEGLAESNRWIQSNTVNGHRVPLQLPWELKSVENADWRFDYLDRRRAGW